MRKYLINIVTDALTIVLPLLEKKIVEVLLPLLEKKLESLVKDKMIPALNEEVKKLNK